MENHNNGGGNEGSSKEEGLKFYSYKDTYKDTGIGTYWELKRIISDRENWREILNIFQIY